MGNSPVKLIYIWTCGSGGDRLSHDGQRPNTFISSIFVCFCCFTSHVNSYGHCGRVSSLNHTFSWAGLSKRLTKRCISGREENDCRNYFMINLHESMGPGRDQTRGPWICSQTRICSQTCYRLRYAARYMGKKMLWSSLKTRFNFKIGRINNIEHNKDSKIYPQNQVFPMHSDMGHCFS